jgi:hypothetical protein
LLPVYERLEAMGIEPLGEESSDTDFELSRRVIADAKAIRDEWELEPGGSMKFSIELDFPPPTFRLTTVSNRVTTSTPKV